MVNFELFGKKCKILLHLHAYGCEIGISVHVVSGNGTSRDGDAEIEVEETFEKPVEPNVRMMLS